MKKIKYFVFIILFFSCSQLLSQDHIIYGTDDETLIAIEDKIESSNYLNDKSKIDYRPICSYDGVKNTAWCVGNNGIGDWIKFYFRQGPPEIYNVLQGKRNVYKINLINGVATNKKLYYMNNRIKKMRVEFSDGQKKIIKLKDKVIDYQSFKFNIRSKWVKLIILEIYKGSKYNDTCISEFEFRTIYDLTKEELKKHIKKK